MEKKKTSKTFETLDIYLSSYLSLKGIQPSLELKSGRVVFVFAATDQLHLLMREYNSNPSVPLLQFITEAKALRGQMLSLRGRG